MWGGRFFLPCLLAIVWPDKVVGKSLAKIWVKLCLAWFRSTDRIMNHAGLDAGRYYEEFHGGMSSVKLIFLELFQAMRMNIEH